MADRLTILEILQNQDTAALDPEHVMCVRKDTVDGTFHGTVENAERKLVAFVDVAGSLEEAVDKLMTQAGQ